MADEGASLDAQRSKIEAWAAFTDCEIVAIHEDRGISGKRADNRPALQDALAQVRQNRCGLVVYSISRLSRSVRDTLAITDDLDRWGGDLISLSEQLDTSTAAGRLTFKMFSLLAEFEREQLAERTATAMGHLRQQNRRISGAVPFGWTIDEADGKTLVPVEAELLAIDLMADLRDKGRSFRAIAQELTKRQIAPKTAKKWSGPAVRGILLRRTKMMTATGA
jgi:DNA invertase Pin-like site-specific DNA recombinase